MSIIYDEDGANTKFISSGVVTKILCPSCSDEHNLREYSVGKELTMRLIMMSITTPSPTGQVMEIRESYDRITDRIKSFEKAVWFEGLQREVRACKKSGMSMVHDGMSVLTFTSAGRAMITIQDEGGDVTFITDETSRKPCMGLQGVHGTESKAFSLMERAELAWASGIRPSADREVSIL